MAVRQAGAGAAVMFNPLGEGKVMDEMTVKCLFCAGRGWTWVGVGANADREECDECHGQGRVGPDWMGIRGMALVVFSTALVIALVLWGANVVFGQAHHPEDRTVGWFRTLPDHTKVALVAGAMATVGHVGVRCPQPMTAGEQVAYLTHQPLALDQPWIAAYFTLITARGCRSENDEDPAKGA